MKRGVLTAVAVAAVSLVIPVPAHAAGVQSITLSPSSTALTVEPGIAATRNLTIINDGDVAYTASVNVAPYHVSSETYDPQFTRVPGTTDPSAWIKLGQTSVTLQPHATATVPYVLTAPPATAAGGYYAVIFVESAASPGDGGVSVRNRVGDILYVTVSGTVKQAGTLAGADLPKFTFGTGVPIGVRVSNTGGVHFQSDVKLGVTGLAGKSVFSADQTYYVLPQTTRLVSRDWSPTSFGGVYKISRSATVAGADRSLPDDWIVVVTPKVIPLVVFVALAAAGFFILLGRTRKRKT